MPSLERFEARMRYWCDEADMGYSQADRWDFNPLGGNCDCSSLVIHCLREAGFDTGGATYTGNLSGELTARGWVRVAVSGDPLPGDILLNDSDHVAVCVGGGLLCQASISETGGAAGAAGDQTGGETNTSPYYDYPWDCYLRYVGPSDGATTQDGTNDKRKKMEAIIQINDEPGLYYFDGARLHQLHHPDELKALQMVAQQCGRDLPAFKLGSGDAPWGTRLMEALR
ncbi:endolysin-like domain-containing protein [Bifidobacterium xylocopae]|uniref:hypothetical protein n=1 Tax=Bifidobacterium xylocopae TaxID=2493119 RepID=UPI001F227E56|nr:hypothetical protein [Bifidobacterium xylocopae]